MRFRQQVAAINVHAFNHPSELKAKYVELFALNVARAQPMPPSSNKHLCVLLSVRSCASMRAARGSYSARSTGLQTQPALHMHGRYPQLCVSWIARYHSSGAVGCVYLGFRLR
jgi:hypothetical protein